MKKNGIILSALILISAYSFAQTGVGTTDPKATLDVVGKPTETNIVDGVKAPHLTGAQLKAKENAYGFDQTGAIVYVTSSAAPTTPKTLNVTTAGYYYFDGNVWVKIVNNTNVKTEPWYNQATNTEATLNTQNIYQIGNVAVGTNTVAGAKVEAFTTAVNNAAFKATDGAGHINSIPNLAEGAFNSMSSAGDVGLIFSTDNDATVDADNGLVIASHTAGGAGSNKGMKIMETGLVGIGAKNPTERLDVGVGNVRVRSINTNEGNRTTDRKVVADANGVLKTVGIQTANLVGSPFTDNVSTSGLITANQANNNVSTNLGSHQFMLTQTSLVIISYSVSFTIGSLANANDSRLKRVSNGISFSQAPAGNGILLNQLYANQSQAITVSSSTGLPGIFHNSSSFSVVLTPGQYTVNLNGGVAVSDLVANQLSITFGAGERDFLTITAVPL